MKYPILLAFIFFCNLADAQIYKGELQAAGLTCAMCSNAIYKSLKTLKFIEEVDVDLNRSLFVLSFKQGEEVSFDAVREKVEDAGFSLSSFVFSVDLNNVDWVENTPLHLNGSSFCLMNFPATLINNKHNFKIVNRGFLSEKDHKKYLKDIAAAKCSEKEQRNLYYLVIAEKKLPR